MQQQPANGVENMPASDEREPPDPCVCGSGLLGRIRQENASGEGRVINKEPVERLTAQAIKDVDVGRAARPVDGDNSKLAVAVKVGGGDPDRALEGRVLRRRARV